MNSFRLFLEAEMQAPHFPYLGSKYNIRNWIIQYMPSQGRIYVEPFAGRGNMFFLAKGKLDFKEWHINDLNSIPFFQGIQSVDTSKFPDAVGKQVDRDTWLKHKNDAEKNKDPMSLVLEPGIAHMGHYGSGWAGGYTKTRSYDKQAYSDKIMAARETLKDVKMTGGTWQDFPLDSYKKEDFIYIDPPYLNTDNRHYKAGADSVDHPGLLKKVQSIKARWLLSHTYHPLYIRELGNPTGMKQRQAAGKAVGHKSGVIIECLWKGNY